MDSRTLGSQGEGPVWQQDVGCGMQRELQLNLNLKFKKPTPRSPELQKTPRKHTPIRRPSVNVHVLLLDIGEKCVSQRCRLPVASFLAEAK